MIDSSRVEERMKAASLSQAELARRVGVSQPTIYKLLRRSKKGSTYLHRIARELGTTPAYLTGETDDPDEGAPPLPPPAPMRVLLEVVLPAEDALTRMFKALLGGIDPAASEDERALLLAQRLPIGLAHLQDLRPATTKARRVPDAEAPPPPSTPDLERTR